MQSPSTTHRTIQGLGSVTAEAEFEEAEGAASQPARPGKPSDLCHKNRTSLRYLLMCPGTDDHVELEPTARGGRKWRASETRRRGARRK